MKSKPVGVSFVIPCLNEAKTLPMVLAAINKVRRGPLKAHRSEIIVSDNGSTDGSQALSRKFGARVVPCKVRGYGAALRNGFNAAKMDAIIFADADFTYDFEESPLLVEKLTDSIDMVVGSRLRGKIVPGAMPWKHRWLGTPVLTFLINFLHGQGNGRYSDCNSGFRLFRKKAWNTWEVKSDGMEFASEMLVKAMRRGATITEVPVTLRPDQPGRIPHLRTWQDGMRHFLQIFVEAPGFFQALGITVWTMAWAGFSFGLIRGITRVGPFVIFGLHSQLYLVFLSCFGLLVWSAGLFLAARKKDVEQLSYRLVLSLNEDRLFFFCLASAVAAFTGLAGLVVAWGLKGFVNISYEGEALLVVALAANLLLLSWNAFTAHMMKRL